MSGEEREDALQGAGKRRRRRDKMKKEQWAEMTECMAEEPSVVTDYLETMYDELAESDIAGFYEAVFGKKPEEGREAAFERLLSELYELTEERQKEFLAVMRRAKKLLVKS